MQLQAVIPFFLGINNAKINRVKQQRQIVVECQDIFIIDLKQSLASSKVSTAVDKVI